MEETGAPEGDASLDKDLARLVGEVHAADAAAARVRERYLRAAAAADATLVGILVDLAEQGDAVVVRTTSGRSVHGRIAFVAMDAVAVDGPSGVSYVRIDHLASVRHGPTDPARRDPAGDRPAPRKSGFTELIAEIAADRPRVAISIDGEDAVVTGELTAVGQDIMTLRLDGDGPAITHLNVVQVSVLTVLASG